MDDSGWDGEYVGDGRVVHEACSGCLGFVREQEIGKCGRSECVAGGANCPSEGFVKFSCSEWSHAEVGVVPGVGV